MLRQTLIDASNTKHTQTKENKYMRWFVHAIRGETLCRWGVKRYFSRCEEYTGTLTPHQKFGMLRGMLIIAIRHKMSSEDAFDYLDELEEEMVNFGKTPGQIRWDARRELVLFRQSLS